MTAIPDIRAFHARAVHGFAALVALVRTEHWGLPTPCAEWDVRALVNHLVYEELWTPPMLEGKTIAEIGEDAFGGDLLGDDPATAQSLAAGAAVTAANAVPLDRVIHVSFAELPAQEYLSQLFADHLIHGWDLARAIGAPYVVPSDLRSGLAAWFDTSETLYREFEVIAPEVPGDFEDLCSQLLARFGRDPAWTAPA